MFVGTFVTKLVLGGVSALLTRVVLDKSNPLNLSDSGYIRKLVEDRTADLILLFLTEGTNGLFNFLRLEAEKTENDLDDIKVTAIENSVKALIRTVFQ